MAEPTTLSTDDQQYFSDLVKDLESSGISPEEAREAATKELGLDKDPGIDVSAFEALPPTPVKEEIVVEPEEEVEDTGFAEEVEEVEEAEPVVEEPIVVEPEVVEMPDRPEQVRAERPTSQAHLDRDFDLETEKFLRLYKSASTAIRSNTWFEEDRLEALDRARVRELDKHAKRLGLKSAQELQDAAKVQGIGLESMMNEIDAGRNVGDLVKEARDRGIYPFLETEREKEAYAVSDDARRKQIAHYLATGEGPAPETLLDTPKMGLIQEAEDMPMLGLEVGESKGVTQPGEKAHTFSLFLSQKFMEDPEIAELIHAYSAKERGIDHFVPKRAAQIAKRRGLVPGTPEYLTAVRDLRPRALREVAALKAVGIWTAPAFLPEADFYASPEGRSQGQRIYEAFSPTIEIVGIAERGGKYEIVVRQESPLLYVFNMADSIQAAAIGLIEEGSMIEGIAKRRNALEVSIDSDFAQGGMPQKIIAGVGGFGVAVLAPDLFSVASWAYKAPTKIAGALAKVGIRGRKARRAISLLDEIAVARAEDRLEDAAIAEVKLREEFAQRGGLADLLDAVDADVAKGMAETFPDIFDMQLARGLPDEAGRRALSLHPSGRKIEMEEGLKEGEELIFSNYKELFSTHLHLDELAAVRRALVEQGSAARLPLLRKAVHQNLTKLDELLDTKMDVEAAAFMNVLRDTLSDALENPKAWRNRIHGAGNVDNELLKVKSLRGPTVEEVNAATGRKKSELILKQKLLEKKRHEIHKEIGRIVTKVTKAEDPILTVDRAIEALKASNESRAMAAELLKFAIMGREKIKPISALARPGTKTVKELSGEGHLFAKNVAKAFGLDEEQALFVARITDARARAWATVNNKDPGEWYRTRIQAVTRLTDETSLPDNILRQMLEEQGDAAIFYSGLRAATEDLPENIRVDSVINTLKKSKAAPVTEDEIRDTGLRIWLDEQKAAGKSRVSRDEMLAFLDDHSAGVEVISLGEMPASIRNKLAELRPTFSAWTNLLQSSGYEAGATHEILSAVQGGKSPWRAVVENIPTDVQFGSKRAVLFDAHMLTSLRARISEAAAKGNVIDPVSSAFADAIEKRAGARQSLLSPGMGRPGETAGMTAGEKLTRRLDAYDAAHKEYMRLFDELDDEILFENIWTKMGDVDAEKFADDVGLDEAVAADGGVYATIQGTPIDQRFTNPATIGVEMGAMRAMARADLEAHRVSLHRYFRPMLDDRTAAVQKGAAELELLAAAAGVRHPRWPEYTMGAAGRAYDEAPEGYAELLITVPKKYRKAPASGDWQVEPSNIPAFSTWLASGQGMSPASVFAKDQQSRVLRNYGLSMDDYDRMAAGQGGPSHFVWGAFDDLPDDARAQVRALDLFVDASTPGSPRVLIGIGNSQEEALSMARTKRTGSYGGQNHFESVGDDAIMAHVRVSTREGPNGERLLFIEEIQSDWHQGARKVARGMEDRIQARTIKGWREADKVVTAKGKLSGYRMYAEDIIEQDPALLDDMTDVLHRYLEFDYTFPDPPHTQDLLDELAANQRTLMDFSYTRLLNVGLSSTLEADLPRFGVRFGRHPDLETAVNAHQGEFVVGESAFDYGLLAPTAEGRRAALRQQAEAHLRKLTELHNSSAKTSYTRAPQQYPKAPWADDWYKLAIKRAVRYASDNGYDGIAVTKSDIITPIVTGPHSTLMDGKRMAWEASALLEEATQHPAWAKPVRLGSGDRKMWKVAKAQPGLSFGGHDRLLKDYEVAQGRADARKAVLAEVMEKRGLKLGDSDATDAVYDAYTKNDFDIPWDSQSIRPSRDVNLGVGMMDPTQDGQLEFIQELVKDGHARIYRGNRGFYEGTVPGYLRSYLRGFEAKGVEKAPEMAGVPPAIPKRKGAKAMVPFSLQEAQDSRAKAEKIANDIATALDEAIDTSKMSFDDLLLYLQEEKARRAAWPVGRTRLPDMEHVRETQRQGFRVPGEGYDPQEVYERVFPAADVVMFTDNMKTQAAKRTTLYQRMDHRMDAGEGFYSAASRAVEKLFGEPHTTPRGTRYGQIEGRGPSVPIGVDVEAVVPAKDLFRKTIWNFEPDEGVYGDGLLMTDLKDLDYNFQAASKLKEMREEIARRLMTHMDEVDAKDLAEEIAVDLDMAYESERPASLIALLQRGDITEEVAGQLGAQKQTRLNLRYLDPKSVPDDLSRERVKKYAREHHGYELGTDVEDWVSALEELVVGIKDRINSLERGRYGLDPDYVAPPGISENKLIETLRELGGWIQGDLAKEMVADMAGRREPEPLIRALRLMERANPGMVTEEFVSALGLRPRVMTKAARPPLRQLTEAEEAPRRFLKADYLLKSLKRQDEVTERELSFTGLRDWLKAKGAEQVSLADVRAYMRINGTRTNTYMMGGMTQLDFTTEVRRVSINLESALDLAGAPLDVRKAAGKELRESVTARGRFPPHEPSDVTALGQRLVEAQYKDLKWYKDAVAVLQSVQPYLHDRRVADAAQEYYNFLQKMVRRRQTQGGTRTTTYFENTPKNPGGKENYREMTLTLPVEHIFSKPRRPGLREMGVEKAKDLKGYGKKVPYHFGSKVADPDIPWVHIRMSDRFLEDGTKVLGIDEIQSDWLQAALRRGTSVKENKRLIARYESTLEELARKEAAPDYYNQTTERLEQLQTQKAKIKRYLKVAKADGPTAPNPFQDGWEKTTMRRILAYAADNGYDQVAFSSGDHVQSFVGGKLTGQRAFYDTVLPGAAKNALRNVDPKATFGYAKIKTLAKSAKRPEIPVKPEGWTRESALARLEAEIAGREEFARTADGLGMDITRYSDHTNEQVRRILRGDVERWDVAKGRLGGEEVGGDLKRATIRVLARQPTHYGPPEEGDMRLIADFIGVLNEEEAAKLLGLKLAREGVAPEDIVDTNKFFTVKLSREGADVIREKGFALYQKNAPKAQTGWQMRQLADGSTELTSTEIRAARQAGMAPAEVMPPSGFLEGSTFKDDLFVGTKRPTGTGHTLSTTLGSEYGIYLTPRRRYAQQYGEHLQRVKVSLKNPKYVTTKADLSPRDLTKADINALVAQGYDGIVVTNSDIARASEVVLFDPKQAWVYRSPTTTSRAAEEVMGGGLTFKVDGNTLRVQTAEIPEAMRGKGYGTDLYLQAMQHAKAKGLGFASDVAPDPDALAVYNRLIEAGIPLRRTTDVTGAKPVQRFTMDAADLKRTDIDAARATFRHKVEGVAKGATQFVEDGKAIIYGFKQADLTTALHELGHVFRRDLTGDDLRIMEQWCGVKAGKWTVEAEEKFARGFEHYMASGEAPNAGMREIFEKLKVWITEIYRGIKNTPLDEQIPDNVKDVYRRMLDDAPPNSPPLPRILRHMDSQLVGPPERGNVAALEDLVQEALHLGIPGVNRDALLASLKESGTVTFPKAVRGRKVWTLENLGTHQLELESEAQAVKRTKAPNIALASATHAVAEETPVDRMRNFFSGTGVTTTLIRGGLHTVFGGDPSAAMRTLNPAVRDAAFAAGRTVEQAYGDTIRLVGEGDWTNLVRYLGGEPVKFKSGRDAFTSNYDAMGAVAEDLNKFFNGNLPRQHREALLKFVEAIGGADPKRVGRAVELARGPEVAAALDYMFNSKEAPAMLAHLREALKLTGAIQPAREGRLLEALLHASNVTARNGVKYDGAGLDRADFVLKAVQDVFGKDKAMRAAVLFGGYGQAVKARQSWVGMGIAIDAKDHKLLLRWLNGMNIPKEELPRVHAMVVKYNLNPTFMSDAVLDVDMYVPKAARERMAQALARGSEMIDPTMKLRGEGFQENNLRSGWATAYRYMKTRMTRGSFFVRQRYFFMNTFDHFTQMAMIVGFRPAFASTLRVIAQDVMVIPGVARAIYIIEKLGGDPQLAEKTRKSLQGYGDTFAQFFGGAKYNIHVNHVLEGVGPDGAKTFRVTDPETGRVKVYNYQDIRDIAVQEGIFASFDTRALEGAVKKSTNLARTDWIDARYGLDNANAALNKVQDTFADFTGMVTETAETWSERERLGGMITLMEQGVDPRTAARLTIDALYDYAGSMTKFDRNIMINLMFPFWAFQKNANRQVINAMFSPWGAYRMGVLRRVHELGPDVMTHLLYDRVVEPYGLDIDAMPPDLQDTYWTLRNAIEYGRGDLEDLRSSPGGDELVAEIEAVFGPVSQMKPEIRLFLENGYGGPQNVPPDVVRHIRAYFANTSVKAYDETGEGKLKGAQMFTVNELLQKRILSYHPDTSEYYVPKPSAAGRRSYMRDRSGFALTAERTKAVRDWLAMVPGDHPYVELYLPDSTINAGFRHSTAIAALMILGGSAAVEAGRLPFKEDDGSLWLHKEAIPTLLATLGDPLGAPVPALLQNFVIPESETAKRWGRVHPWTAEIFTTLTGVELVNVPEQRKQGMEEGPEVPLELVGVKRKGYKLMPPGTYQILFRNSPFGELNDILLRWDKAPLEERMGIQGELVRWARGVTGMQTSIVSRKESARKQQRPAPPRPE